MSDPIQTIRHEIDKKIPKAGEGFIQAVRAQVALVRPVGSTKKISCEFDPQQGVSVGKRCAYRWVPGRNKYVIQSVFGVSGTVVSRDQNKATFELSPPSNLQTSDAVPNCVLLLWDCPPQQDITFEVQYNDTATDVGAFSYLTRAGGVVLPAAATLYFRVRSITEDWRYSSWTVWGNEDPGAGVGGGGTDTNAIHKNVADEFDTAAHKTTPISADRILIEDSADSLNKKYVEVGDLPSGGGGGTVDTVVAGTGIDVDSSDPANPVVILEDTAVTPAAYTNANITVDQQGRITAASNGVGSGSGITAIFSQNEAVTVVNDAGPTTMIGTGLGSYTIPANTLVHGSAIRITASGYYSTNTGSVESINIGFQIGSTGFTDSAVSGDVTFQGGWFYKAEVVIQDVSGDALASAFFELYTQGGGRQETVNNGAPGINLTIDNDVLLIASMSTASADLSITTLRYTVEVISP